MRSASSVTVPALSAETRQWVEAALARRPRGFLADIDGTLSAIAPTPDQARLIRGVRPLLRRCLTAFDVVAAISGRPALDARRMVGISQMLYIGNHGMERLAPGERAPSVTPAARAYLSAIADALHEARERVGTAYGPLLFENKGVTASIHYRQAADPEAARQAIRRALAQRPLLASAVYLGDDHTDVDAFRALRELRAAGSCEGINVAVGHAEAPEALLASADITLASIAEVPAFLAWLLRLTQG